MTWARTRRVLWIAGVVALGTASGAPAHAATVSFDEDVTFHGGGSDEGLRYVAGAGEVNDLRIAQSDKDDLTFTDPGADIAAGARCVSLDAHTVRCDGVAGLSAVVDLGDLNDTLAAGTGLRSVDVAGGPGDDTLTGAEFEDHFDGGPGQDTMTGGAGEDSFVDADTDPDVIDGGSSRDAVSYASSATALELTGGTTGAGDQLRSVEDVTGTRLDDTIVTGDSDDTVHGGRGDDTIRAGAGDDELDGGRGADRLDGGPGDDTFEAASSDVDRVQCGKGRDAVQEPNPRTYLRGCESITLAGFGIGGLTVGLTPVRAAAGALAYPIACGDTDAGTPIKCRTALTLRSARGDVLAAGSANGAGRHGRRTALVTPTALGARLGRRTAGVRARALIRSGGSTGRFTFTFRLP